MSGDTLVRQLRLMVVTHPHPRSGRDLIDVVGECLRAGATSIQLRDKQAGDEELLRIALALREMTRDSGALLIVNDRVDLAMAAGADGVHLGPDDLPVSAVRSVAPDETIIGFSTDSPEKARAAETAGASYLGIGAVFRTCSKPGLEREAIGVDRIREVLAGVSIPGVGIGGIDPGNAARVYAAGAGVAVLGAAMHADEPGRAISAMLGTLDAGQKKTP